MLMRIFVLRQDTRLLQRRCDLLARRIAGQLRVRTHVTGIVSGSSMKSPLLTTTRPGRL